MLTHPQLNVIKQVALKMCVLYAKQTMYSFARYRKKLSARQKMLYIQV